MKHAQIVNWNWNLLAREWRFSLASIRFTPVVFGKYSRVRQINTSKHDSHRIFCPAVLRVTKQCVHVHGALIIFSIRANSSTPNTFMFRRVFLWWEFAFDSVVGMDITFQHIREAFFWFLSARALELEYI